MRSASGLMFLPFLYTALASADATVPPAATHAALPAAATKQTTPQVPEYLHVNISLSPQIASFLKEKSETLIVTADYYGWPAPGAVKQADAKGEVRLGEEKVEQPGAGKAVFSGNAINPKKLKYVKDGDVQVVVNIHSGRHSSPNELLTCGFYEGSVVSVRKFDLTLTCRRIGDSK